MNNEDLCKCDAYYKELEAYDDIAKHAAEWAAKWPAHCRSCGGWGGHWYPATGPSYSCGGEPGGFDLCGALPEGTCHRCGAADAVDEESEAKCRVCGWIWGEDGIPQL